MSSGRIRLGLVGVGKIACASHVPAIAAGQQFEIVATASRQGSLPGIPAYADLAEMLAAGHQLDAVSLCTPPGVRPALARQALAAGLHVLLEKPPAAALSQVELMREAAATAGRTLFAAWHSRESMAVDHATQWLGQRTITAVRVVWREDVRYWHPGQDWLLAAGGFGVFDPAINALSILTKMLPGTLALESSDLFVPANRQSPMRADVRFSLDGVPVVTCDFDMGHPGPPQWEITVETDAGALALSAGGHAMTLAGAPVPTEPDREYIRLYARFAQLIAAGHSDVDARPLTLVADAMMLGTPHPIAPFEF